jgi:Flp pilus assembly protein TadB
MKELNKRAMRKALWVSVSKFVGVFMGAGAGAMLHKIAGDSIKSVAVGVFLAVASWFLILFSEYKREE